MNDKEINGGGSSGGGGGAFSGGGGGILYPSSSYFVQPSSNISGCENGVCPKPFMTKLSTIVNDPNTNSIISWSPLGNSIIVWDHIKFSEELLPKYFRHNNFSSFVYQLNNYGFRKIGDINWEYENPLFQAGKEHLLANIKRRIPMSECGGQGRKRKTSIDINNNCIEQKLEILRNEISESKLEIEKLKKEQAEMESHILASESDMKNAENKSQKLALFLAKVCSEFLAHKMSKETENKICEDENEKMEHSNMNEKGPKDDDLDGKLTKGNEEEIISLLENNSTDKSESLVQQNEEINATSEPMEKRNSGDYKYWEKIMMMDEYEVREIETEIYEKKKSQAEIAAELELLIANQAP